MVSGHERAHINAPRYCHTAEAASCSAVLFGADMPTLNPGTGLTASSLPCSAEKKAMIRAKKLAKNSDFGLVQECVSIWEDLRPRDASAADKAKLVAQVVAKGKGKFKELSMNHSSSRVVQAVLKHGTPAHRQIVLDDCREDLVSLARSPHGNFVVRKLVATADKQQLPGARPLEPPSLHSVRAPPCTVYCTNRSLSRARIKPGPCALVEPVHGRAQSDAPRYCHTADAASLLCGPLWGEHTAAPAATGCLQRTKRRPASVNSGRSCCSNATCISTGSRCQSYQRLLGFQLLYASAAIFVILHWVTLYRFGAGLLRAFKGSVPSLFRHPCAGPVMAELYEVLATTERNTMIAEFYSKEYMLFGGAHSEGGGRVRSLPEVWETMDPEKRRAVLQHLLRYLQPILEKSMLDSPAVHRCAHVSVVLRGACWLGRACSPMQRQRVHASCVAEAPGSPQ